MSLDKNGFADIADGALRGLCFAPELGSFLAVLHGIPPNS
jgi:hypothetical protein